MTDAVPDAPLTPLELPNLRGYCAQMGVELNADALAQLQLFGAWLLSANQRVNLTAIRDPAGVEVKHMADALSLLPVIDDWAQAMGRDPAEPLKLIDVGTGGGVPGLPLAIARPTWNVRLCESIGKKCNMLDEAVGVLQLQGRVKVLRERVELVARDRGHREQYDVAVARAVASLPILLEWLHPLVKVGGVLLCPQGDHQAEQIDLAEQLARKYFPGTLIQLVPADVPTLPGRHIAVLAKTQPTRERYPRPVGEAINHPLK